MSKIITALLGFSILSLFFFQNCGSFEPLTLEDSSTHRINVFECKNLDSCEEEIAAQNTTCFFNGIPVESGKSIRAWNQALGEGCQSELRKCEYGLLSGSFPYAQCINITEEAQNRPCFFNGQRVGHGESVMAYLNGAVPIGESCTSESRTCQNGELSGSFHYASCAVEKPVCLFDGRTLKDNEYVQAFTQDENGKCQSEYRHCRGGILSGHYPFSACIEQRKSCLFNGETLLDGESVRAFGDYDFSTGQCTSEIRQCENGNLSGGLLSPSCVDPKTGASCKFLDQVFNNEQTVIAYKQVPGPKGFNCESTPRTCLDGVLRGEPSFNLLSCVPGALSACRISGQSVFPGTQVKTFRFSQVSAAGESCDNFAQLSTCQDGSFDKKLLGAMSCDSNPLILAAEGMSCEFRGETYEHGDTRWLYKSELVNYTESGYGCRDYQNGAFFRCENGKMAPTNPLLRTAQTDLATYQFPICKETGRSCHNNFISVAHRSHFRLFREKEQPYANGGCFEENNHISGYCVDGQFMDSERQQVVDIGGYKHSKCQTVGANCSFDGVTYGHGAHIGTAYKNNKPITLGANPDGTDYTCTRNNNSEPLKCIDGVVSVTDRSTSSNGYKAFDSNEFPYNNCEVQAKNCRFEEQEVAHGEKINPRYKLAEVPYVDYKTTCSTAANRAVPVCINGEFRQWKNERGTITLSGGEWTYKLPPNRPVVNLAQYPETTCGVAGAKTCSIETFRAHRDSFAAGGFRYTSSIRSYDGAGSRVGIRYKLGHRPRNAFGQSTCRTPDNLTGTLYCHNGGVFEVDDEIYWDYWGQQRAFRKPVGPAIDTSVFRFSNCIDE